MGPSEYLQCSSKTIKHILRSCPYPSVNLPFKIHPLNRKHSGKTPEETDMYTSPRQHTT